MKLIVAGIGPGGKEGMTLEVYQALQDADIIVGYKAYLDLIREDFPDKEMMSSAMRQEVQRVQWALDHVKQGKGVVLISSGDAGVFGLASLALEMAGDIPVRVLSGVTAAQAASALVGAPLAHDYAVISLSDLLTPAEEIEKKLRAVASSGLLLALYNPGSKKRKDALAKACAILLQGRPKETLCARVRQVGRTDEEWEILSLEELSKREVDMFTILLIGNERTVLHQGKLVTPRGYRTER